MISVYFRLYETQVDFHGATDGAKMRAVGHECAGLDGLNGMFWKRARGIGLVLCHGCGQAGLDEGLFGRGFEALFTEVTFLGAAFDGGGMTACGSYLACGCGDAAIRGRLAAANGDGGPGVLVI